MPRGISDCIRDSLSGPSDTAIKALINGKVQAGVAVDDRGLQYGDGVFETIAVTEAGPITRRIRRALIGENAIIPPC